MWKLVGAMWGQEKGSIDNLLEPDLTNSEIIRRRISISEWGQEVLAEPIQNQLDNLMNSISHENPPSISTISQVLLNFLSGRQLRSAVDYSISCSQFRLSTLLSQATNISMRSNFALQIDHWRNNHVQIPAPLLQLYFVLGWISFLSLSFPLSFPFLSLPFSSFLSLPTLLYFSHLILTFSLLHLLTFTPSQRVLLVTSFPFLLSYPSFLLSTICSILLSPLPPLPSILLPLPSVGIPIVSEA